jgi:hypothetical protein
MASTNATFELSYEQDQFRSSTNTPIGSHLIGSKDASNLNMEVDWQLFISQLQANQKLCYPHCIFIIRVFSLLQNYVNVVH